MCMWLTVTGCGGAEQTKINAILHHTAIAVHVHFYRLCYKKPESIAMPKADV